jgi:hypothetical protein
MQFCRLLSVQVAFMAEEEVATQFLQPQAVIQHLELLLRLVVATAERMDASQLMVVLVAAEVLIILVKESLLELQVKVIPVVGQTAAVTELAVAAAVQVVSVPMRLRNIVVAPAVLVSLRQSQEHRLRSAVAVAVE